MSARAGVLGVHDVGGVEEAMQACMPDSAVDSPIQLWEKKVHALVALISIKKLMTVDELRQGIEDLNTEAYKTWGYYDKWAASAAKALLARGVLKPSDFPQYFGGASEDLDAAEPKAEFAVGDLVRVKGENYVTLWRKPHLRTPGYIHGVVGRVVQVCGAFPDPEMLAFRLVAPKAILYRVRFSQRHLWEGYDGPVADTVEVDVYQHWLEPATDQALAQQDARAQQLHSTFEEGEEHQAHEDHGHEHDARFDTEARAVEAEGQPTIGQNLLAVRLSLGLMLTGLPQECLMSGLERHGHITRDELQRAIEGFNKMGSQHEGARLVARAWVDPEFKSRLLANANAAAAELGIMASNAHTHTVLKVAENTPQTHNLVVCTLCSCYPLSILGPSPSWYKSRSYRARAVREPRKLLAHEFGLQIPDDVAIAVHDSTADLRCMVLPRRPAGTEGLSEEQLQALVTRDSMIGVAVCKAP